MKIIKVKTRLIMQQILDWERITNEITDNWIREYFDISEEEEKLDYYWVSGDIGGIFNFGDYYFNFSDILACYKHGITKEQLFKWYYFCLENHSVNISLARFILDPKERDEAEKKHLEELKLRVESAKKEFKEAIENYEVKKN